MVFWSLSHLVLCSLVPVPVRWSLAWSCCLMIRSWSAVPLPGTLPSGSLPYCHIPLVFLLVSFVLFIYCVKAATSPLYSFYMILVVLFRVSRLSQLLLLQCLLWSYNGPAFTSVTNPVLFKAQLPNPRFPFEQRKLAF